MNRPQDGSRGGSYRGSGRGLGRESDREIRRVSVSGLRAEFHGDLEHDLAGEGQSLCRANLESLLRGLSRFDLRAGFCRDLCGELRVVSLLPVPLAPSCPRRIGAAVPPGTDIDATKTRNTRNGMVPRGLASFHPASCFRGSLSRDSGRTFRA